MLKHEQIIFQFCLEGKWQEFYFTFQAQGKQVQTNALFYYERAHCKALLATVCTQNFNWSDCIIVSTSFLVNSKLEKANIQVVVVYL